ncbi:MAG: NADH-quinone oxidoreductase subunit N [Methylotenera sp.]|nr:NADH-quinone oxidoreductase subunit N [Oligoflexia bacterium]
MKDFVFLLPEIFLTLTVAGIILSEVGYHGEKLRLITWIALTGLVGAFIQTLLTYPYGASQLFSNAIVVDGFSLFFKLFFITLAMLSVLTSARSREIPKDKRAEFTALILGSTIAMCLIASAADLLLAFLCLQFLNGMSYILSAQRKLSVLSTEASFKHLAFGAVSAALLLYGVALLFAGTQSLNIYEMHRILSTTGLPNETALVVFILVFMALSFQFAAFPMHLWAPDVLEGAPTPVSAFISVGTRAAGFAFALRLIIVVFAQPALAQGEWQVLGHVDWTRIVALVSGITMVVGSLLAFRQNGAKRLVAYLVVAQSGYLLMGLLVLDEVGLSALLFNLVVELFALMGIFYILSFLFDEVGSDQLSALKGTLRRAVPECVALILFLACLVGIPPLPGFIGKFTLIGAAIRHEWNFLAALAILSSAIGAVAIARLAYSLVGDFKTQIENPTSTAIITGGGHRALLVGLLLPMILLAVFAETVLSWAGQSIQFILW